MTDSIAQHKKLDDMAFMFLMLNVHKAGAVSRMPELGRRQG